MRRLTTTLAASLLALLTSAVPAHAGPGDPVDDTVPPVITFTKPAPVWNGWYAALTVVGYSAKDPGSGVASQEHVLSGATIGSGTGPANITIHAEGRTTLTVTATDFEGNVATASTDINIDRTGPVVTTTIADGTQVPRNAVVHLGYSCADQFTPVTTCDGSVEPGALLDTASPGPHTVDLRGIDIIGNSSTRRFTYNVTQGGLTVLTAPTVQGSAQVGRTLTATAAAFDPAPDSVTYTWLRNGTPAGTGTTREVVAEDVGARLSVVAHATKAGFDPTDATSAPTAPVLLGSFDFSGFGVIEGTAAVGQTLTFTPPTITPTPTTMTTTWVRDGRTISQSLTYDVTALDLGSQLTVVTQVRRLGYGNLNLTSETTLTIVPGTYVLDQPSKIVGTAELGATLRAVDPQLRPAPDVVTHHWLRDGAPIAGATADSYQVTEADIGHRLTLVATATSAGGDYRPITSSSTATPPVPKVQAALQVTARALGGRKVQLAIALTAVTTATQVPVTGTLTITDGKRVVATMAVSSGDMQHKLGRQRHGKHRYVVTYSGSSTVAAATTRTRTIHVR